MVIGVIVGNPSLIILGLLFAVIQSLWMYCVRHRIAFATAVLQLAIEGVNTFSNVYFVSFISVFVQALWVVIWVMGVAFVIFDGTKGMFFHFLLALSGMMKNKMICIRPKHRNTQVE